MQRRQQQPRAANVTVDAVINCILGGPPDYLVGPGIHPLHVQVKIEGTTNAWLSQYESRTTTQCAQIRVYQKVGEPLHSAPFEATLREEWVSKDRRILVISSK
jgi:hypothetical protein